MNIPQPEGGGNGESAGVVNEWLLWRSADLRSEDVLTAAAGPSPRLPARPTVAPNHHSGPIFEFDLEFF
jgi:hypothetical protein